MCVFGDQTARILDETSKQDIMLVIDDSKNGAKSSAIIVFVVCAPCTPAGEPMHESGTVGGIAESNKQCGCGWHME